MSETGSPRVLIIDDEADIRELLSITMERMGLRTVEAGTVAQAHLQLEQHKIHLCLTDMRLPDGNGIELVRHIQSVAPGLPVAVITAHGNMESAVEALKAGAFDFVSKPLDLQALRSLVNTALRLDGSVAPARPTARTLIGDSSAIAEVRAKVARVARSQAPVYISGESGTGKELVARMIHDHGPRASGPFVPVNCGAIAPELMESELFGHKKGAFTGAHVDRIGLFEAADGGTLFLDEVADLPVAMQVKLLRAIQEKSVRPVGAQREVSLDARIVSATHKSLGELVGKGLFRQDLFYRINVIELNVPPLRERRGDIDAFATHFIDRISSSLGQRAPELDSEAVARLERHDYPGNVRELENIIERAVALSDGRRIRAEDLGIGTASSPQAYEALAGRNLDEYLADVEIHAIESALDAAQGNKSAAARRLGLKLGALRYRMQKLGME
jgi:two-component system, NtrC family, response regulator PilR